MVIFARTKTVINQVSGAEVRRDVTHEFDVFSENIVQLIIFSKVRPILREKTLQDILPTLQFTLHNFEQDLLSNLM